MWGDDDQLGFYGPWDGWPEPPRRSEYGLLKAYLDGVDYGDRPVWDGDGEICPDTDLL